EFDDFRSGLRQHQTDVEKPDICVAIGPHPVHDALDDMPRHVSSHRGRDEGTWCERSHPTCVRTTVVIEDAFVILSRAERLRPGAVAQKKARCLDADETLLDDES